MGDLVGCGISHPCTTFDKWPLLLAVDDEYTWATHQYLLLSGGPVRYNRSTFHERMSCQRARRPCSRRSSLTATACLQVDALHTIYWEEVGNPDGVPVLFLHGGPGRGLSPQHRRFFDPAALPRRSCSISAAPASRRRWANGATTPRQLLVEDIETLRAKFGIEQWLVFGGSWGSTLALAYGEAHPERCLGFVLRGIFLCTASEIDWFLQWRAGVLSRSCMTNSSR